MCRSSLHPFLAALPKCEHHLHIEGSLSPSLLFDLAEANNVALPPISSDPSFLNVATLSDRYERFESLDDFLHYYFIGMSVLRTQHDFYLLASQYFTRAHADGVVHAEVFFDPQAHTSRDIPYSTVVAGLVQAQNEAREKHGMTSKLILCFLRNLPVESGEAAFGEAQALGHFSDGTVVGIGMDSSEVGFPPELFRDVYALAGKEGIRRTAHAGEEGDAGYVRGALDVLGVSRIDHGIRMAEDIDLVRRVARDKILVTLCPLSNVRLQCVEKVGDLPIRMFLDEGVRFSINSDDPAYFGGYILDNYCKVHEAFDLSVAEWKTIADNAIEGSWCDEERKQVLLKKVEECVTMFQV